MCALLDAHFSDLISGSNMHPSRKSTAWLLLLLLILVATTLPFCRASCALGTFNGKICSGNGKCNTQNLCECDSRHSGYDCSQRTSSEAVFMYR